MATMAIGGQEMVEMQARPSARRGASVAERNRELFEQPGPLLARVSPPSATKPLCPR